MTDKPRRPWFQIHLSTAIVLMFVAGGILWLNVTPDWAHMSSVYGWPKGFYEERFGNPIAGTRFFLGTLILNIIAGIIILGYIAFLCEAFLRRREARAP